MCRSIIHLNIADFAAAVEKNLQPSLKDRPFVIAPTGLPRAVVYDMSEAAYKQGIRKGMSLSRVQRRYRKIPILPPRLNRYEQVMKHLLTHIRDFTPLIESGRHDGHIFMDVTGSKRLFGQAADIAAKLKTIVKKELNLYPVWSVATNKLVAKAATRVVKPRGEYIVVPGDEQHFLARLPIRLLPGFEPEDQGKLEEFNLFSVSQARTLTKPQLEIVFPGRSSLIYHHIRGIDTTPVTASSRRCAAIHTECEFGSDTNHTDILKQALYSMVEQVCLSLRRQGRAGAGISIIISYADGLQKKTTGKITPPTANDRQMFKQCRHQFDRAWTRRVRIRHIRLSCEKFAAPHTQALLFGNPTSHDRHHRMIAAMDNIRKRFGHNAIKTGLTLASPTRILVPG